VFKQIFLNRFAGRFLEKSASEIGYQTVADNALQISGWRYRLFNLFSTGIGISEEAKTRIAIPFEQEDGSSTCKYWRMGLGLSITIDILRKMKTQLETKSVKNQGTKVAFSVQFEISSALSF
jgi:K+-sensing histidine kinase KdpD